MALVCKIGNEELKYHFTCAIPIIVTENAGDCVDTYYTHAFSVRIIVIQCFKKGSILLTTKTRRHHAN